MIEERGRMSNKQKKKYERKMREQKIEQSERKDEEQADSSREIGNEVNKNTYTERTVCEKWKKMENETKNDDKRRGMRKTRGLKRGRFTKWKKNV